MDDRHQTEKQHLHCPAHFSGDDALDDVADRTSGARRRPGGHTSAGSLGALPLDARLAGARSRQASSIEPTVEEVAVSPRPRRASVSTQSAARSMGRPSSVSMTSRAS